MKIRSKFRTEVAISGICPKCGKNVTYMGDYKCPKCGYCGEPINDE